MTDPRDNVKKLQELEQAFTMLAENMPPMWRRVYLKCLEEGFTEDHAIKVICAMAHGLSNGKLQ